MQPTNRALFESLESRIFLSATASATPTADVSPTPVIVGPVAAPTARLGLGQIIRAISGDPFTQQVAFYASANPNAGYTATINWGDGTTSAGALVYGANSSGTPGYEIFGSHIYADSGVDLVRTTLFAPVSPVGTSTADVATQTVVETFIGAAVVTPPPAVSPDGVTLSELAGQQFTASVGTVLLPAVQNEIFTATINWGDGTTSQGALSPVEVATGAPGTFDEIIGSHTYGQNGNYPVSVVVDETSLTGAITEISTLHSIIDVFTPISLTGTITGNFKLYYYNPFSGMDYYFSGTGTAGALGAVSEFGTINAPGLHSPVDEALGTITLSNSSGSVTLEVTGPTEMPLNGLPTAFTYTILSGTGAYFGDTATGTLTLVATLPPTGLSPFTFIIS
jgi:hypothetical protein